MKNVHRASWNDAERLSPVTVVGAGMSRQLLGIGGPNENERDGQKVLFDWEELLRNVAKKESSAGISPAVLKESPTLQWDEMVRGKALKENLAAHKAEKLLRRQVAHVIREASQSAGDLLSKDKLRAFRAAAGDHVVSLNFDLLLLNGLAGLAWPRLDSLRSTKGNVNKGGNRYKVHLTQDGRTYWFPHGAIKFPDSICLGLRDYGFSPLFWDEAFVEFKAFERCCGGKVIDEAQFSKLLQRIREEKDVERSFRGHLFLAPLIFFGTSLHSSEWGLWWMLNQRARNLARLPKEKRPPTAIIINKNAVNGRLAFWEEHPAGVEKIVVGDWDEGWQQFLAWLHLYSARA